MPKFTERFLAYSKKFHEKYGTAVIDVDFSQYTGNRNNPDETANVVHIYTQYENRAKGTMRLHIESVILSEIDVYHQRLWGDKDVMALYGNTKIKDRDFAKERIEKWRKRLDEDRSPFSGLSIYTTDTHEFVGHVIAGASEEPNTSDLAGMIVKEQQQKGYGAISAGSVVFDFGAHAAEAGYKLPIQKLMPESGGVLERFVATANPQNNGSAKILTEYLGFRAYNEGSKFDSPRVFYEMQVVELGGDNTPTD